jgi:hypothetical protein
MTPRIRRTIFVLILLFGILVVLDRSSCLETRRTVAVVQEYESQTEAHESQIPGAGLGLYAKVKIESGAVIGTMGGKLRSFQECETDNGYLAQILPCARASIFPFKCLDGKEGGGNIARANFAPAVINQKATNFQNAWLVQSCKPPFVKYVAARDIEPGEEIWVSYGTSYDYGFMELEPVKSFFCARAQVDCSEHYVWQPK